MDEDYNDISEEDRTNKDYFDEILQEILERKLGQRFKREANPEPADKINEDDFPHLLSKTIRERQSVSTSQTVGSMLARIPGILTDHGVTFESIGNNIVNFESSLERILASGLTRLTDKMGDIGNKIERGLSQNLINGGFGEQSSLKEALDNIAERMSDDSVAITNALQEQSRIIQESSDKESKALHDGFDQMSKRLGDESDLKDVIHDGLRDIVEKMTDESHLEETLHAGMDGIIEKLGTNGKLEETLHAGMDGIIEKLGTEGKLEEAVHDGLHSIASKLEDNTNIENTLSTGLSGISQKLDQVTNYGLNGIMTSIENGKNPIINIPSSLGTSCKYFDFLKTSV